MKHKMSIPQMIFTVFNYLILTLLALACLLPLINVMAVSLSSSPSAAAGVVKLWPVDFTLSSYKYVLAKPEFIRSLVVSFERLILGVAINMIFSVLVAYPLSKSKEEFRFRGFYVGFFLLTILFSGGLIPGYMTVKHLGLLDKIWVLVLPGAVQVFNIILLMNFFRDLPKEIEEAALVDGANHWRVLWKIFIPLSKPALATLVLFSAVNHWNSWFDGLIFMNNPKNYPLQSYLQTVIVTTNITSISTGDIKMLSEISDRTTKAAQIFVGSIPILITYPFLQKYFMKGIVMGSVKG